MPTWTALDHAAPDPSARPRSGGAMEAMDPAPEGVGVFEMEDGSGLWEVGRLLHRRRPGAAPARPPGGSLRPVRLAVSELPEIGLGRPCPPRAGPRRGRALLPLRRPRRRTACRQGRTPLLIEASMAFGTGHHGTTLGCLLALDRLLAAGEARGPVLDLGCGTAVLAMAAAREMAGAPVIASDIDPVAIEVARANLAANGLEGAVTCLVADGTDDPALRAAAPYGLIFANILMGPLTALAPSVAALADARRAGDPLGPAQRPGGRRGRSLRGPERRRDRSRVDRRLDDAGDGAGHGAALTAPRLSGAGWAARGRARRAPGRCR